MFLVICIKCYNTKISEPNLTWIHWIWAGDFDLTYVKFCNLTPLYETFLYRQVTQFVQLRYLKQRGLV